jgi:hypothetical protein
VTPSAPKSTEMSWVCFESHFHGVFLDVPLVYPWVILAQLPLTASSSALALSRHLRFLLARQDATPSIKGVWTTVAASAPRLIRTPCNLRVVLMDAFMLMACRRPLSVRCRCNMRTVLFPTGSACSGRTAPRPNTKLWPRRSARTANALLFGHALHRNTKLSLQHRLQIGFARLSLCVLRRSINRLPQRQQQTVLAAH